MQNLDGSGERKGTKTVSSHGERDPGEWAEMARRNGGGGEEIPGGGNEEHEGRFRRYGRGYVHRRRK